MSKNLKIAKIILLSIALMISQAGCVKNIRLRGFSTNILNIDELKKLIKNKEDALNILGSPSTTSVLGEETWYYINVKEEYYAFLKPNIIDQKTFELRFNDNDIVTSIRYYDIEDHNKILFSQEYTYTEGDAVNPLKTIFRNLGKFNKNERKSQVKKPL